MLEILGGGVFIWCFNPGVDELAKSEDIGSGDYDCDCVIEWRGEIP